MAGRKKQPHNRACYTTRNLGTLRMYIQSHSRYDERGTYFDVAHVEAFT